MSSLNKVTLIGNLGKDPVSRSMQNGQQVVNMSLATTERWSDRKSGEKKERTEWHNVTIFNDGLGKIAMQYLKKGSKVYIEGKMQTRKWEKNGVDHYSTDVVLQGFSGTLIMLDSKASTNTAPDFSRQESVDGVALSEELDDAIPF